jgi:hypothetical protein
MEKLEEYLNYEKIFTDDSSLVLSINEFVQKCKDLDENQGITIQSFLDLEYRLNLYFPNYMMDLQSRINKCFDNILYSKEDGIIEQEKKIVAARNKEKQKMVYYTSLGDDVTKILDDFLSSFEQSLYD